MNPLLPSASWLRFLPTLWNFLAPRERWLAVCGLTLPLIQQFATMGSFMLTMKVVMKAIHGNVSTKYAIMGGLALFAAFSLAAAVQWVGSRVEESTKALATRLARRLMIGQLRPLQDCSEEVREVFRAQLLEREGEFVKDASQALVNMVLLGSAVLLVATLATVLLIMAPLIGGVLILFGLILLLIVRHRVRKPFTESVGKVRKARQDLNEISRRFTEPDGDHESLKWEYEHNTLDELQVQVAKWKKRRTGKLNALVGLVSALLLGILFALAVEGYFSHLGAIGILVIVYATRLSASQGRNVLTRWSAIMENRAVVIGMHNQLLGKLPDYTSLSKQRGKSEKQADIIA